LQTENKQLKTARKFKKLNRITLVRIAYFGWAIFIITLFFPMDLLIPKVLNMSGWQVLKNSFNIYFDLVDNPEMHKIKEWTIVIICRLILPFSYLAILFGPFFIKRIHKSLVRTLFTPILVILTFGISVCVLDTISGKPSRWPYAILQLSCFIYTIPFVIVAIKKGNLADDPVDTSKVWQLFQKFLDCHASKLKVIGCLIFVLFITSFFMTATSPVGPPSSFMPATSNLDPSSDDDQNYDSGWNAFKFSIMFSNMNISKLTGVIAKLRNQSSGWPEYAPLSNCGNRINLRSKYFNFEVFLEEILIICLPYTNIFMLISPLFIWKKHLPFSTLYLYLLWFSVFCIGDIYFRLIPHVEDSGLKIGFYCWAISFLTMAIILSLLYCKETKGIETSAQTSS